jgi:hypothetical protein
VGYGIQYGRENKDDGNGNDHHLCYEIGRKELEITDISI